MDYAFCWWVLVHGLVIFLMAMDVATLVAKPTYI